MSEYIHNRHNVSVLMYHFVCPAKYRRVVFYEEVDQELKELCQGIEQRYDIRFLEIGTDNDHVHFLVQSVPKYSPTQIIRTIKSITAKGFSPNAHRSRKNCGAENFGQMAITLEQWVSMRMKA